jgi:Mrp family chromosome partitioning ATPase
VGEITEALRRAQEERERQSEQDSSKANREPQTAAPPQSTLPPDATAAAAFARPEAPPDEPEVHIPVSKDGDWVGRAVVADDDGVFAESYRNFGLRLSRELEYRKTRGVLITSAVRHDGKTTTACNLTLALASVSAGRRIALVDLDLRRPAVAQTLGIGPPEIGMDHVLRGEASLDAARIRCDAGVDLFALGKPSAHAHEILARPELGFAISELLRRYHLVVFDAPSVLVVPDVSLILIHLEACIPVARAGTTPRSAFRAMIKELPDEKIVGAFLNGARAARHYRQYDYEHEDLGARDEE